MFNSWDKNDPKDAQVILQMLRRGAYQRYVDPQIAGHHDLQELAKTYYQVSRARTKVQPSLINHSLPLYFPKMHRYWCPPSQRMIRAFSARVAQWIAPSLGCHWGAGDPGDNARTYRWGFYAVLDTVKITPCAMNLVSTMVSKPPRCCGKPLVGCRSLFDSSSTASRRVRGPVLPCVTHSACI
ncbi:hypothetical protein [Burkholderia vietnamiensis]|uniref:hypothetical protein n=1 Tax=Burkholderia vietnamiensis TaxID=60552 RepID=UPI003D15FBC0